MRTDYAILDKSDKMLRISKKVVRNWNYNVLEEILLQILTFALLSSHNASP